MHNINQVVQLLRQYLKGEIHPDSNEELQNLLGEYPDLLGFVEKLETKEGLKNVLEEYKSFDSRDLGDDGMLQGILSQIRQENKPRIIRFNRRVVAVAASVAVLFFVAFYMLHDRFTNTGQVAIERAANLLPGTNKAMLTTSDGRQLELSSSYEGIVVGDQVFYEDGSVLLDREAIDEDAVLTLSTPRGGQYQVTLSDGTKVRLNADSKLRYPQLFSGSSRMVEVEGEAYFEVARDVHRPFVVQTNNEKIEVLGTHFNVNAYVDESVSAVTLLEGKVKVSLANQLSKILHPGQQSVIQGDVIRIQEIDVSESVAWKNGEFMFNNESLSSVMRKLARWYDIEVDIAPNVQEISIWGSISRYENFNEVLQIIKLTDDNIQFEVEGRRVKLMK